MTPTPQSRRVSVGLQLAASTRQLLGEATRNDPGLTHEFAVLSAVASGRDQLLEHFQTPDGATPTSYLRRHPPAPPRSTEHRVPFTVRLAVDHLATIDDLWRAGGAPSRAAYVDEALRLYLDESQSRPGPRRLRRARRRRWAATTWSGRSTSGCVTWPAPRTRARTSVSTAAAGG